MSAVSEGAAVDNCSTGAEASPPTKLPGERFDLLCGECGAALRLRHAKRGLFYGCTNWPKCVSTHPARADGGPHGMPSNKATRCARIRAHAVFDEIWKRGPLKRHQAYKWMRRAMGLSASQARISTFDVGQCEQLIRLVFRDYPKLRTRYSQVMYGGDFEDA